MPPTPSPSKDHPPRTMLRCWFTFRRGTSSHLRLRRFQISSECKKPAAGACPPEGRKAGGFIGLQGFLIRPCFPPGGRQPPPDKCRESAYTEEKRSCNIPLSIFSCLLQAGSGLLSTTPGGSGMFHRFRQEKAPQVLPAPRGHVRHPSIRLRTKQMPMQFILSGTPRFSNRRNRSAID